ncbi:MAG: tRNA (guanosine(37)-N1)-methyltransferase TrmD [Myxococcota bacterium]|nr:tRNA (guanosine(37)-N1)-methyltransferase TrmD [Myxococcota bacterium]MDW8360872.1 tRNA (guanosine(37)-N1)-methyltransferase TrmD [Myxococcales bacterium]
MTVRRYDVITLMPETFSGWLDAGLLGKARASGRIRVELTNPRSFTTDAHRTVDDVPYGGGAGMVLMAPPLIAALEDVDARAGSSGRRILLTPQGRPFGQADARRLAQLPHVVLVCGRYEGFDERIAAFVHEEISVGDYVLFGGEVAAMVVLEATIRLVPGVLGNARSSGEESFESGLLEYPQWTRPAVFRGMAVPDVLRSGDHAAIARFRRKEALRRTALRRPDLLARATLDETDRALLDEIAREPFPAGGQTGSSD